jgi:hypothetical protein
MRSGYQFIFDRPRYMHRIECGALTGLLSTRETWFWMWARMSDGILKSLRTSVTSYRHRTQPSLLRAVEKSVGRSRCASRKLRSGGQGQIDVELRRRARLCCHRELYGWHRLLASSNV